MNDFLRNPELDRLVHELNRSDEQSDVRDSGEQGVHPDPIEALDSGQRDVRRGSTLERLLNEMARQNASDLVLVSGAPPILRISGELRPVNEALLDGEDIEEMFAPHLMARVRRRLELEGSAYFSLRLGSGSSEDGSLRRFRVNIHRQRGDLAAAIRSLPLQIPTLADLNLPGSLADLVIPRQGLVLVCGPTGGGKSSTLSALVGEINRSRADHIITIEDPVEYEHRNVRSVIEQIEIGRDSVSFSAALRAALRQDPDVILVGEMRDLDTVATALTAAETGHLILSTLHTSDAEQAIHRIIDVFPPVQQSQIRHQLALSLNAVVCQQLIPRSEGSGRVPAVEVLVANQAVRNHIRNEKLQNLVQEITLGRKQGMISLEDSLARLVSTGVITVDAARARARRIEELESYLRTGA